MRHTRFELGFPRNRKVSRLSDSAFRLWVSAIDHSREQRTDGAIEKSDLAIIPRGAGANGWKPSVVRELVDAGLWRPTDSGWEIHEFLTWQDSKEHVDRAREQARDRMTRVRSKNSSSSSREVRANFDQTSREVAPTYSDSNSNSDSDSSDPDFETRASGVQPVALVAEQPKPRKLPSNLTDALLLPIAQRAEFVEQNKHLAEWVQPEAWPEVKAIAAALHAANRGVGAPKVGKFGNDSGVKRVIELYAAGFSQAELEQVCERVVKDPWWTADGGKPRSLGALTVEVARRATAAPGALEHAGRFKAAEGSQLPYHQPARRLREGAVMPPTEVKALLDQVLAGAK